MTTRTRLRRGRDSVPGGIGSLEILVVDDEPMVGELMTRVLADAGHRVRTTTDPHEALRLAASECFDLVVTDRSMPLMNGEGLASAIKATCPSTRILLVTGSGGDEVTAGNIDGVVEKPFTPESLQRGVAEVFAGPPRATGRHEELIASTR